MKIIIILLICLLFLTGCDTLLETSATVNGTEYKIVEKTQAPGTTVRPTPTETPAGAYSQEQMRYKIMKWGKYIITDKEGTLYLTADELVPLPDNKRGIIQYFYKMKNEKWWYYHEDMIEIDRDSIISIEQLKA